jgi:hypothetical protein
VVATAVHLHVPQRTGDCNKQQDNTTGSSAAGADQQKEYQLSDIPAMTLMLSMDSHKFPKMMWLRRLSICMCHSALMDTGNRQQRNKQQCSRAATQRDKITPPR